MDYQHWLREAISQLQASESPRRDAPLFWLSAKRS